LFDNKTAQRARCALISYRIPLKTVIRILISYLGVFPF
jgi:hypothetical protein